MCIFSRLLWKSFLIGLILNLSFGSAAEAHVDFCPLSNPTYRDLRSAASALEQQILFPEGCEDLAQKLKEANQQVASASSSLSELNSEDPSQSSKGQRLATIASGGLSQISQLFQLYSKGNDKCGRALLRDTNYLLAFIDTVNELTPLLMAFGGSTALPATLGVTILGSATKTIAIYFNNLGRDMSTSQARQAFINNSCGYYRYNEIIRSFIQTLKGQTSSLDKKVIQLQIELDQLKDSETPKPSWDPEINLMDKNLHNDHIFFTDLSDLFGRSSTIPDLQCHLIKTQVEQALNEGRFPTIAIQTLRSLLDQSSTETHIFNSHRSILNATQELMNPELYKEGDTSSEKCIVHAREWMNIIKELLAAIDAELSLPGRRDLSATPLGVARKKWEKLYSKKLEEFTNNKNLQTYLHSLAQKGSEIDLSELLDARDKIRRQLFGDGKDSAFLGLTHRRNPAEAWLEHKWFSAELQLKEFHANFAIFTKGWLKKHLVTFNSSREKQIACGYAEDLIFSWNTASKDIEASRFFCDVFQQTINESAHPYVTEYCLGSFDKNGVRTSPGKLALTDLSIFQVKRETDRITTWVQDAKCERPKPMEGSLLTESPPTSF